MREALIIDGASKPGGTYSHAVVANGFVYVSGQTGSDPKTGETSDNFQAQVRQTLTNLKTILDGAGSSLADVVKINAYLTDMTRFDEWDEVYREFFPSSPPARTTIACQLYGVLVEVDCVAVLSS